MYKRQMIMYQLKEIQVEAEELRRESNMEIEEVMFMASAISTILQQLYQMLEVE